MGTTTNILDMNNRISALEKDVTSVEEAVDTLNSNLTIKGVNVTLSDKCAQGSLISSGKYGNIVVFSVYIITASACSRNDVLATFDLPSDFSTNYFSDFTNGKLNLATHTKNLVADGSIAQGVTIIGQIIGIIS
jgi:hypothetical protein